MKIKERTRVKIKETEKVTIDERINNADSAKQCSIGGIAYELGHIRCIKSIDALQNNPEELERYLDGGLKNFAESNAHPIDLACLCASRTLEITSVDKEKIRAVIFTGANRAEYPLDRRVYDFLSELGLEHANPIGAFALEGMACSSPINALRLASGLIQAECLEYVLIVSADNSSQHGRFINPPITIKSDGAVSFLVSAEGKGKFDILNISEYSNAKQAKIDPKTDYLEQAMAYPAGIRKATKLTLEAINKKPKDFRSIITNNYILHVVKQSVKLCGFDEAKGYYENIPRFAHTIAGDVMINLCDLHSKKPFKSDDLVFLLATSPSSWHTVALRKT